ncbi:Nramp family divalent metal transporter [Owenweeksia hongkongensis]|uniref:Nramp family divalent metal transporter n=1 Tax=Owenweeksia hongkongensis TaxID=253245 RepID=UPI003A93B8D7
MKQKLAHFLKSLGPGLLFASTCIGVSHLVQSTRAGALYGFGLLWAVMAANLFKYPFFEYASRYANATGTSIIDGYLRLGKWMLWLYAIVTLSTMFFVTAAVGAVTAGFFDNLFGISSSLGPGAVQYLLPILFLVCILILYIGQYKILDSLIKIVGAVLLLSTVVAFVLTLIKGPVSSQYQFFEPSILDPSSAGFAFAIALMGWMPTALDISSWTSLWTLERIKQTNFKPALRETLREFNFGYIVSAILAPCFLLLGAYLLYGTGYSMPSNSAAFANGIIELFTQTMGDWSYLLIAASGFSIMFGTCIAVFDGYARTTEKVATLFLQGETANKSTASKTRSYHISLLFVGVGAYIIIYFFGASLKDLVDLATTISFIVAPIIALVNFRLVTGKYIDQDQQPSTLMRWLSYIGIIFLLFFSIIYIVYY